MESNTKSAFAENHLFETSDLRWKSHFRGPKIKNFPGEHVPGPP